MACACAMGVTMSLALRDVHPSTGGFVVTDVNGFSSQVCGCFVAGSFVGKGVVC